MPRIQAPACPRCGQTPRRIYTRGPQTANGYVPQGWLCACHVAILPLGVSATLYVTNQPKDPDSPVYTAQELRQIEEIHARARQRANTHRRRRPGGPVDSEAPDIEGLDDL